MMNKSSRTWFLPIHESRLRIGHIILAIALILLAIRYFLVLVEGYDTFEGNNDPEADWLNYITYTILALVVARQRSVLWAVLVSMLTSAICEGIRQLLIITGWMDKPFWPEISTYFWSNYPPQAALWFIVALMVGGIAGLAGGLLGKKLWWRSMNTPVQE